MAQIIGSEQLFSLYVYAVACTASQNIQVDEGYTVGCALTEEGAEGGQVVYETLSAGNLGKPSVAHRYRKWSSAVKDLYIFWGHQIYGTEYLQGPG